MRKRLFAIDKVSREEETALLREFFGHRGDGFFVDVGANDPFHGSTSWIFEQDGWSGLLIEPIPALAERLRQERRGRVFNCACSTREDAGKMLQFWIHPENSGWSTFNPELSPWFRDRFEEIEVPVRTLDEILEEAGAREGFELLAMDVEFHEISVLSGCDLAKWRPRLIFVEDHAHDHRLLRHLRSRGYRLYRRSSLNSWFIPRDSPLRSTWAMRWGILRKYYLSYPIRKCRMGLKALVSRLRPRAAAQAQENAPAGPT